MEATLKAACVQMNGRPDRAENLKAATALIREAAGRGAQFIATPEYSCIMVAIGKTSRVEGAQPEESNDHLKAYRALADELGVWLLIGSIGVRVSPDMIANRSFLLDDTGGIVARYDKIHMFDADLPNGQSFRESNVARAGDKAVVARTPWGGIGMTVCFDIRFAYLYRALAQAGASILTVPSAYSVPTGSTTWEIFNRARAAETGCFVISPAQVGNHEADRFTWGHSMIVDPVGKILAEGDGQNPGVIVADLDLSAVARARANVPAIMADRKFTVQSDAEPLKPLVLKAQAVSTG